MIPDEIKKWANRLRAAGVKPEVHSVGMFSDPVGDEGTYCWVRFDPDLLCGIGYTGRDWANSAKDDDRAFVAAKGKTTRIWYMRYLTYARASEGFELNDSSGFRISLPEGASKNQ